MEKTIGDLLVEATKSSDPERRKQMAKLMHMFWGGAEKQGMPTPESHPPQLDDRASMDNTRD